MKDEYEEARRQTRADTHSGSDVPLRRVVFRTWYLFRSQMWIERSERECEGMVVVSREGYIGQCQWEQDPAVTLGACRGDGDGVVATHVHSLTPPSVARSSSCGDAVSSSGNIPILYDLGESLLSMR